MLNTLHFRGMFSSGLGAAFLPDGSPINLHFVMFIPTIVGQGSFEQFEVINAEV